MKNEQVTITIKNDDEGFFGYESTDTVNVAESISNYENELKEALLVAFPSADITLEYGNYAGASIIVSDDSIEDEIAEIVALIYDRGTFWSNK